MVLLFTWMAVCLYLFSATVSDTWRSHPEKFPSSFKINREFFRFPFQASSSITSCLRLRAVRHQAEILPSTIFWSLMARTVKYNLPKPIHLLIWASPVAASTKTCATGLTATKVCHKLYPGKMNFFERITLAPMECFSFGGQSLRELFWFALCTCQNHTPRFVQSVLSHCFVCNRTILYFRWWKRD